MENIRVTLITIPEEKAEAFARKLVEERIAACVNVLPGVKSTYWWKGKIESANECMIVAKTTALEVDRLMKFVKANHPYEVPEVLTLHVAEGLPNYIDYVIEEMGK